jgi:hypothetical protein
LEILTSAARRGLSADLGIFGGKLKFSAGAWLYAIMRIVRFVAGFSALPDDSGHRRGCGGDLDQIVEKRVI